MVISLLLLSKLAIAEDFKNLNLGDTAPFSGTIITPDGIAKIITIEDSKLKTCEEKLRHEIKILTITKDTQIEKLKFDLKQQTESCDSLIKEKDKQLDRVYEIVKKQNRNLTPLWLGIGFTAGLATSLGTYYVYSNL